MAIKNRKVKIVLFLIAGTSFVYLLIRSLFRKLSEKVENNRKMIFKTITDQEAMSYEILRLQNIDTKILKEFNVYSVLINKIQLIIDVLKINTTYSVGKTIVGIIQSKDDHLNTRKVSLMFLANLIDEYSAIKTDLLKKIEKENIPSEKEKLNSTIKELDNLVTLMSTVSDESSDTYIDQIYLEIINGTKKIRNI